MKSSFTIQEILKTLKSNNKGFVLPSVLVVLAIVFCISAILLSKITLSVKENAEYRDHQHCLMIAQSALEECKANIDADPAYSGTNGVLTTADGGSYSIQSQKMSDVLLQITVKGMYKKYTKILSGQAILDPETHQITSFNILLEK